MSRHRIVGSSLLIFIVAIGVGLAVWKANAIRQTSVAAANVPEPMESVTVAVASERKHRQSTTSIGTVTALRSITLQNEVSGTVRNVSLVSGRVVEAGTVLVTLDTSVERAELKEEEARAALAQTQLARLESVSSSRAISRSDLDRARSELNVALAQVARTKAVIARKVIRAPFRARVGIADVHPGQYLSEGTQLTTLQGVDESVHVDFEVAQHIAAGLVPGDEVDILTTGDTPSVVAKIIAVDSRIDPTTRNATIRAKTANSPGAPVPGASVRVQVPAGPPVTAVAVPVISLRKGPSGDHVFVVASDKEGKKRAQLRQVVSGPMLGDEVLILKGLSPGEYVAASGSFKLRDGALVAMAEASKTAQSNSK